MRDYFSDKIGSPLILPVDLVAMTANAIDYTQRLHNIICCMNQIFAIHEGLLLSEECKSTYADQTLCCSLIFYLKTTLTLFLLHFITQNKYLINIWTLLLMFNG